MSRVTLGDVAIERRETLKGAKADYPIVGLEHLIPSQITLTAWGNSSDNTFSKVFHKGQVLFGRRRAYLKKAAVAPFDGLCSSDITVIEAKANLILPELLPFVIQNDAFFDYAVGKSAGSLSPRVKWEHLKKYEFELPGMDEQRKLAELLWSMVEAKEAYQELLRQTDDLVKARFIEMFGDAIENEMGWPQMPLCKVLAEGCTVTYGIVKTGDDIPNGVPVFRPVDISQGHVPVRSELKRTSQKISDCYRRTLLQGDELLITVRGSIGETFQISDEFAGCNVARNIVPLRANPQLLSQGFLKAVLDSAAFQRRLSELTKGVALKGINMNEFKMCPVILPPLPRQEQFLTFQSQSDKSKFELGQAVKTLGAIYNKIISENLN
ncbi:restriction endonuclease subunit S [Acutalibacter intestini]|uniref:restriction endonuclease subunit S n=1 Tax=Acutalibacter intestini TaxID=3093659 RepID=UPI002AC9BF35|nr:restriction endonuclease subunit S [Acutalibacter sp. M00204]